MTGSEMQLRDSEEHARFVELCALYSTGSLSRSQLAELDRHIAVCQACKVLVQDYARLIEGWIPILASDETIPEAEGYEQELAAAKTRLLADLNQHSEIRASGGREFKPSAPVPPAGFAAYLRHVMPFVLSFCLAGVGYWAGLRQSRRPSPAQIAGEVPQPQLAFQLADARARLERLDTQISERSRQLVVLTSRIENQSAYIAQLKQQLKELETAKSASGSALAVLSNEDKALKSERDLLGQRLQDAQTAQEALERQFGRLQEERVAALLQTTNMQKRIDDLTAQVNSQQATISERDRLLASDRDVRELMGARDLLIADVFDVDPNGKSRRPFGRVFYTKNKSLIFYAFDLDKQGRLHSASTFQAWGARSTPQGDLRPVNMGILYLDNELNRRWALKFDNPKVLEQIDAVFVTVEPDRNSVKPRGKQLLYAYLRGPSNHP